MHYTTCCKHSLVLLRMGEIIARNMLSLLKLLIKLLLLHLVGCLYVYIYVYIHMYTHTHTHTHRYISSSCEGVVIPRGLVCKFFFSFVHRKSQCFLFTEEHDLSLNLRFKTFSAFGPSRGSYRRLAAILVI